MEMATRTLLRVDSGGGLTAGVLVLLFRRELSAIENLPEVLLLFTGAVNVGYGLYSGSLLRGVPAAGALRALVVANAVWAGLCVILAAGTWGGASGWGTAHLAGEGGYVGLLAWVEYRRFRHATVLR
jgi:hypothetical protein